ncbi:hypothetical protein EDB89DRAFT_2082906 [Lactarius sanguifluus]|nr:hypothetical protein EDB89DRAFT_2082906 [Lactarius sanguifluus]
MLCCAERAVYEFYASGRSYEELHEQNRSSRNLWGKYIPETFFKFVVNGYNHSISKARQRQVIEDFSYMWFMGKVDLVSTEITMAVSRSKHEGAAGFREAFFGRLLDQGSARSLIKMFDVKKRQYFGNTSMEAEISLLMANQTLASPGKLIYDPFIGTSSLAYTTAHFGAFVFGSDIDGRQMRGKGDKTRHIARCDSIWSSTTDFRVVHLKSLAMWRRLRRDHRRSSLLMIAPDGVRAGATGAKRLGRKRERTGDSSAPSNPARKRYHTGICDQLRRPFAKDDQPYLPPTKPYELSALAADFVVLVRYLLNPSGRLVFFVPTVIDEYKELDLDSMLCDEMEVVANSLHDFGAWGLTHHDP